MLNIKHTLYINTAQINKSHVSVTGKAFRSLGRFFSWYKTFSVIIVSICF